MDRKHCLASASRGCSANTQQLIGVRIIASHWEIGYGVERVEWEREAAVNAFTRQLLLAGFVAVVGVMLALTWPRSGAQEPPLPLLIMASLIPVYIGWAIWTGRVIDQFGIHIRTNEPKWFWVIVAIWGFLDAIMWVVLYPSLLT